jgi:hypothetical protein
MTNPAEKACETGRSTIGLLPRASHLAEHCAREDETTKPFGLQRQPGRSGASVIGERPDALGCSDHECTTTGDPGARSAAFGVLPRDLPMATAAPRGGLLLVHGADDRANAEPDCAALAQRLAGGLLASRVTYRGASYGWDFPLAEPLAPWLYPTRGDGARVRIRPWPALTAFSASEAASFLAASLGHGDQ